MPTSWPEVPSIRSSARHAHARAAASFLFAAAIGFIACPVGASNLPPGAGACGELANPYGPFDYMDPEARKTYLPVVEANHFTPEVEQLQRGKAGYIAGDLDYTLRAFPNHHRALNAMARLDLTKGSMNGARYTVECYFNRAIRWRPEDAVVRMLLANYYVKKGNDAAAKEQYETALKIDPQSPEINYNAGLFYASQRDYVRARALARTAYAGGYPLQGLKKKLIDAGQWGEE